MNTNTAVAKILGDNPGAIVDSPISELELPGKLIVLLEENGFSNLGDLAMRLENEPKSILDISGIGPKTLLSIQMALEDFVREPIEEYREPVPSLGDQFKSMALSEPVISEEKVIKEEKNTENTAEKKEKKSKKNGKKKKKGNKKDKKPDKKKENKSKKKGKKKKKDKKSGKKKNKK